MRGLRDFFRTKRGILTLVAIGSGLLLLSFQFPYWNVKLMAPQYPQGLYLSVYMDRVEGDVSEVNLLNHYIGMGKLDEAAPVERKFAGYGLALLSVGAFFLIPAGKKLRRLSYVPPILFLTGFIGDFWYWLYRAGHDLSPDAPVTIRPFTPTLLGFGKIGNFSTTSMFGSGFWLAVLGTAILFYAIRRKQELCLHCEESLICSSFREDLTK